MFYENSTRIILEYTHFFQGNNVLRVSTRVIKLTKIRPSE